jgi:hypothetical protein
MKLTSGIPATPVSQERTSLYINHLVQDKVRLVANWSVYWSLCLSQLTAAEESGKAGNDEPQISLHL